MGIVGKVTAWMIVVVQKDNFVQKKDDVNQKDFLHHQGVGIIQTVLQNFVATMMCAHLVGSQSHQSATEQEIATLHG